MSFVAVAAGGAALLGAGASIYAGSKGAGAQKDAAAQNAQLQREQNAESQRQYDLARADQAPYRDVGTGALYKLSDLMGVKRGAPGTTTSSAPDWNAYLQQNPDVLSGFYGQKRFATPEEYAQYHWATYGSNEGRASPFTSAQNAQQAAQTYDTGVSGDDYGSLDRRFTLADFEKDPGYEFRRTEGLKGVENSAAARGGILSGAALKAIDRYNSDYASNEYGNAYNRFNNDMTTRFNRLSSLAGTGQTAANNTAQIGQQYVGNMQTGVNNITSANNASANARASQYAGVGNAIGGAANQVGQYFALRDLYNTPGGAVPNYGTGTPMNLTGTAI